MPPIPAAQGSSSSQGPTDPQLLDAGWVLKNQSAFTRGRSLRDDNLKAWEVEFEEEVAKDKQGLERHEAVVAQL